MLVIAKYGDLKVGTKVIACHNLSTAQYTVAHNTIESIKDMEDCAEYPTLGNYFLIWKDPSE